MDDIIDLILFKAWEWPIQSFCDALFFFLFFTLNPIITMEMENQALYKREEVDNFSESLDQRWISHILEAEYDPGLYAYCLSLYYILRM